MTKSMNVNNGGISRSEKSDGINITKRSRAQLDAITGTPRSVIKSTNSNINSNNDPESNDGKAATASASPDWVCQEFWRIVESAAHERPVRVEYGSDVDTSDVGSGFPSHGPYASSGWNTNNLATLDQSMLKYLDGRISLLHYNTAHITPTRYLYSTPTPIHIDLYFYTCTT
jgi:hypothetical protein